MDLFQLSDSTVTAPLLAPIERVNIAGWIDTVPDSEYRRCSLAHVAAGYTTTDDGKPMSVNVEFIGDALVVQQYVAEIHEPLHCRMVSTSDVVTKRGRTTVKVIWDLSVRKVDENTCEYRNHINAYATKEFEQFLRAHNTTLEQAAAARQEASDVHNHEETPYFALSIAAHALGQGWHTFEGPTLPSADPFKG